MSLILEKYHGFGTNYLIYDINRNKRTFTNEIILSIFKNNLGHGTVAILVGPYQNNKTYACDVYNQAGELITPSLLDITTFEQYLIDRNYVTETNTTTSQIGGSNSMNNNSNIVTLSMNDVSFHSTDVAMHSLHGDMINIPFYFGGREYWGTCLSYAGSHLVIPMEEISSDKIKRVGALAEHSKYFDTAVSTEFVKVINRNVITIEMYEEGIGYTTASLTCASAACAAMYKLGLVDDEVTIHMAGGSIQMVLTKAKDNSYELLMKSKISSIGHVYLMNDTSNTQLNMTY